VTQFIPQIIALVQKLIEQGHAYVLEGEGDRDVYFSTDSFPGYGKLSRRNREAMEAGGRLEADERKRNPRDFALWKAAKPGEPWWESPWGHGRPGWHIECSTMAMETLGEQIDIHGGGADLIFPHHENEIAQSESLTGKPFARYWVHTGLLHMGEEKMAHSGIFVTVKSALEVTPAPALRLYLLSQSYRTPSPIFPSKSVRLSSAGVVGSKRGRRLPDSWATLLLPKGNLKSSPTTARSLLLPWTMTSTPPAAWQSSMRSCGASTTSAANQCQGKSESSANWHVPGWLCSMS